MNAHTVEALVFAVYAVTLIVGRVIALRREVIEDEPE